MANETAETLQWWQVHRHTECKSTQPTNTVFQANILSNQVSHVHMFSFSPIHSRNNGLRQRGTTSSRAPACEKIQLHQHQSFPRETSGRHELIHGQHRDTDPSPSMVSTEIQARAHPWSAQRYRPVKNVCVQQET